MPSALRVGVLVSGTGTTLQALIDACRRGEVPAEIALVASNVPGAFALERARDAGIATAVVPHRGVRARGRRSRRRCGTRSSAARVDLVCLAGFLRILSPEFVAAFAGRLMNIHPSLLPAFGGKGMYGDRVHDAVLKSGARITGCTVHFVTDVPDGGPIIAQAAVPVEDDDTIATLAARVRREELRLYPDAVRLFAEGRLRIEGNRVRILDAPASSGARQDTGPFVTVDSGRGGGQSSEASAMNIRRALLSVADKTGVVEFAAGLASLGVEIISTGGTAAALAGRAGARDAAGGGDRVPGDPRRAGQDAASRGARRACWPCAETPRTTRDLARHAIRPIDLVAVTLYPFEAALARGADRAEMIEEIDIGGVTLLRAAAKNADGVAVLSDPAQYRPGPRRAARDRDPRRGDAAAARGRRLRAHERLRRRDRPVPRRGRVSGAPGARVREGPGLPVRGEPASARRVLS